MIWVIWLGIAVAALVASQAIYWSWFTWGPARFGKRVQLEHAGLRRSYLLYVPESAGRSAPLVLVMHGAYDFAKRLADATHWDKVADEEGFILAFPEGTYPTIPRIAEAWNAGHCCLHAVATDVPDMDFLEAVRDDIARRTDRTIESVFMAGFSNGGMMAYRYAAERPDRVQGVAGVGSALWSGPHGQDPHWRIHDLPKMRVVHVHGRTDQVVPYDGSPGRSLRGWGWSSAEETAVDWAQAWGPADHVSEPYSATVTKHTYASRAGGPVVLFEHAAGHSWPRASRPFFLAKSDPGMDAERAIWAHWNGRPIPPGNA